jgi:ABC-type Zn2+ transport system substrate-binding protein/surface adhesin
MTKYIERKRSPAVKAWLKREIAEQKNRYRAIVKRMDARAAERDQAIAAFLGRIQTRGFSVTGDQLRKISAEEIPKKPRRKFKVVF